MTNYNEKITKAENLENLNVILDELNNDILDNADIIFDMAKLEKSVAEFNKVYKFEFYNEIAHGLDLDRKATFEKLVKNANFKKLSVEVADNGKLTIKDGKTLFKFAELEKHYQTFKAELDANGKPIRDKSITIFGALRFYGLCEAFIRNMFIGNLTIDNEKAVNLSKVKIADKTIFDENDGKCFTSNSNNALEKQLNILTRFFELDVKMLKKDLPILKMAVQKIKRDIDTNKASIKEVNTLKFADILFSVITTRFLNDEIKVYTNDGKEVKTEEDNKTE